ncbi:hypothetical protein PMAYCL1PPCAC_24110, partial [Pristionchus mayeri]
IVRMAPRKKKQSTKKVADEDVMEEAEGGDTAVEAEDAGSGGEMGAWDDDVMEEEPQMKKGKKGRAKKTVEEDEMEEEPQPKKGRKGKAKANDEEDEDIGTMVDRPRLTIDSALSQLKAEEISIREFIDELKSKRRHLQVEEERLRLALNQKLAQEMAARNDETMDL